MDSVTNPVTTPASPPSLVLLRLVGLLALGAAGAALAGCETRRTVLVANGAPDGAADEPPADGGGDGPNPGSRSLRFAVRPGQVIGAISAGIYGMEYASASGTATQADRPGLIRFGNLCWGSTYNWETNAGNGGITWCFENGAAYRSNAAPGDGILQLAEVAGGLGATAFMQIPLLDYVAADRMGGSGPPTCSGDVRNDAGYRTTRFRRNLPRRPGGLGDPPDLEDGVVYQDEMVAMVRRSTTTPVVFALDRLPQLWHHLMPHLHPARVGYAELTDRELVFAAAARDAWPEATIVASSVSGWAGLATLDGAPDQDQGFFLTYFLDRLASAESTRKQRLIDAIDVEWSPELPRGDDGDDRVVEERLQSPRSLWDESYIEGGYVAASVGGAVRLLPRLREMIAAHRPGLDLAFTGWNYGGSNQIIGALVTADVLGVFGREGVRFAVLGAPRTARPFSHAGLHAFRNFDGAGARFGDTAVHASTNDRAASSVYASTEATDPSRLVVVVIHKQRASAQAEVTIESGVRYRNAAVYRVTADAPEVKPAPALVAETNNVFRFTVPALSVTVIVPGA